MLQVMYKNVISLLFLALLLFVPAWRLNWPAAWFFIIECGITGSLISWWLYKHDPTLLEERSKSPFQPGQKKIDKLIMLVIFIAFMIWFPLIAVDANYIRWAFVPVSLQITGAIAVAMSMWICFLVFKSNTFAATAIRVQKERNQKVISTGPYAIVRHPMYGGVIFFFIGAPLLLGSWLGVFWGIGLTLLMGVRAVHEEKMLIEELEGYREYKVKVPYRFIPYVW